MRALNLQTVLTILCLLTLATAAAILIDWTALIAWGASRQRLFQRELATHLRDLAADRSWAIGFLVGGSFLYGILHAIGPGHGKIVIATYLSTRRDRLSRGVALAVVSALCQGVVAVCLVTGLTLLADLVPAGSGLAVRWSERVSFALLAVMGAGLTIQAGRRLIRISSAPADSRSPHHHHHADGCGCRHVPSPADIAGDGGGGVLAGIILSIGLRPCSGAVLVLAFANSLGQTGAGIAAAMAMAAGTAITVALLAVLVVTARQTAIGLTGPSSAGPARLVGPIIAGLGGLAILGIGGALLIGSFAAVHPLL